MAGIVGIVHDMGVGSRLGRAMTPHTRSTRNGRFDAGGLPDFGDRDVLAGTLHDAETHRQVGKGPVRGPAGEGRGQALRVGDRLAALGGPSWAVNADTAEA